MIEDVLALVRHAEALSDGVRIDVMDGDGALGVALPASKLTQVLLNLVLNAGASIAGARRDAGHIVIRARAVHREGPDRLVRIEVDDDGPGTSRFRRCGIVSSSRLVTTKQVGEGTGLLGLAVCRGLVESAGGEIAGVDASRATAGPGSTWSSSAAP